jgi:NAD-dependent SIR2 family protein deacetylase
MRCRICNKMLNPSEQAWLEEQGLDPDVCSECHDVIHETLAAFDEDDPDGDEATWWEGDEK